MSRQAGMKAGSVLWEPEGLEWDKDAVVGIIQMGCFNYLTEYATRRELESHTHRVYVTNTHRCRGNRQLDCMLEMHGTFALRNDYLEGLISRQFAEEQLFSKLRIM